MKKLKVYLTVNILITFLLIGLLIGASYIIVKKQSTLSLTPVNYNELYSIFSNENGDRYFEYDFVLKSESGNHSETNVQVNGVDESDIAKTDGEYIYNMDSSKVFITSVKDKLSLIKVIEANDYFDDNKYNFVEIYISGDKLIIISESDNYGNGDYFRAYTESQIGLITFDISDKENPKLLNSDFQSGYYVSSRLTAGFVYLVSNYYVYGDIVESNPASYLPKYNDEVIDLKNIYIMPEINNPSYSLISSYDITSGVKLVNIKAVISNSTNLYMDLDSIYISSYSTKEVDNLKMNRTNIFKFDAIKGSIAYKNSIQIDGQLLNQFSMDEYNGDLRVVTNSNNYKLYKEEDSIVSSDSFNEQYSNVYILNDELKVVDHMRDIAPNENVYSVRFQDDIVYFVTFRQIDPLFAVSLTDNKIEILSSLKLPGFSEYLHMYEDDKLLGVGYNANEKGAITGLKLTMFDISDKTNVKIENEFVLEDDNIWRGLFWNHKALLIDSETNIIAFPISDEYFIFEYNEEFVLRDRKSSENSYSQVRGIRIKERLYTASENIINAYNFETLELIDSLELQKITTTLIKYD